MEEDEIQAQPCKLPRVGNCRNDSDKIGSSRDIEELEDGDRLRRNSTNRFHNWHHTNSRIIRVSRASGGKDRHSKVMTSKGLRDRRVRLSVTTAIQFYDLQDRLGYDQPSKAVEWLIKAAADAISELPSLNTTFPDTPKQPSDEKKRESEQGFDDSADAELDGETNYNHHQQNQNQSQNLSLSKSACSSTSETSKGSGLSLSRSEIRVNRVKARERARERAAKEKEKENESGIAHHHHQNNVNNNPMSQTASFTELLTAGTCSPSGSVHQNHSTMEMDYFSSGLLLGPSSSSGTHHQSSSSSSGLISAGQIQLGNSLSLPQVSVSPFNNNVCGDHQNHSSDLQLQQHFSFIPDHQLIPAHVVTSGSDYNLNFTISSSNSGLAGYNNRGTLQSNSPPSLNFPHHLQRYSPIDGSSNVPFIIGAAAPTTMDNNNHHHHQFSPIFDGRLQLCYGDGTRHSDHKGKAKN